MIRRAQRARGREAPLDVHPAIALSCAPPPPSIRLRLATAIALAALPARCRCRACVRTRHDARFSRRGVRLHAQLAHVHVLHLATCSPVCSTRQSAVYWVKMRLSGSVVRVHSHSEEWARCWRVIMRLRLVTHLSRESLEGQSGRMLNRDENGARRARWERSSTGTMGTELDGRKARRMATAPSSINDACTGLRSHFDRCSCARQCLFFLNFYSVP